MPISENELMWARTLPEEVEAGVSQVVGGSTAATTEDEQDEVPEDANETAAAEPDPVVRIEETSRLEATLARLEMNSLQIKMHLDSLEQRMSRMEPYLEGRARSGADLVEDAEPARPIGVTEERSQAVAERVSSSEKSPAAEPVANREAKAERWSHLMGPGFDAFSGDVAGVAERSDQGRASVVQAVVEQSPAAVMGAPEPGPVPQPEAQVASRPSVGPAADRDAWPLRQRDGSAELPIAPRGSTAPESRPATPVSIDQVRGARFEVREPLGSFVGVGAAVPAQRDAVPPVRERGTEEWRETRPSRRMVSVDETEVEKERPSSERGMWRGYRVRRLVWAVVLLVLAAVPLAIWWRLSVEARDADAGDAAPTSRSEPGMVAAPAAKPSAGEMAGEGRRRPAASEAARKGNGSAVSVDGPNGNRAGLQADARQTAVTSGGGAPVFRRTPPVTGGLHTPGEASAVGVQAGERTSSGIAPVGGTAIGRSHPPAGAADEVPGTSAMRVRVPEGVMAGLLLPTGDAGEVSHGSGEVVAAVFISNTGRVEDVEVISGSKGLRGAATRAMRNWRYEPYVQGGVRVPVVTTASIRFDGESGAAQ